MDGRPLPSFAVYEVGKLDDGWEECHCALHSAPRLSIVSFFLPPGRFSPVPSDPIASQRREPAKRYSIQFHVVKKAHASTRMKTSVACAGADA
jgi:hypothetical protein